MRRRAACPHLKSRRGRADATDGVEAAPLWSPPSDAELGPAARGFSRQWTALYGGSLPPLLRVVSASSRWLAALARARVVAAGDALARARLEALEAELATIVGVPSAPWPTRRRPFSPPRSADDLPALDPSQQLWFLSRGGAMEVLLDAAFGRRDESHHAAELRARVCSHAVPSAKRERWLSGFGLMPPDAVAPGDHQLAIEMLQRAFAGDHDAPRALDPAQVRGLDPAVAIDLLMCAVTLRAVLREPATAASVVAVTVAPTAQPADLREPAAA